MFSLITFTWFTVVGETQQNVPNDKPKDTRQTQTKETQSAMTPQKALKLLKEGNERYVNNISNESRSARAGFGNFRRTISVCLHLKLSGFADIFGIDV